MDNRAREIASQQGGVITRRQALAIGLSDRMIFRRTQSGQWQRVAPGTYALHPTSPSRLSLSIAVAKLAAVASHESAAGLHRLMRVPSNRVVVTVPHRRTNRCQDVVVHESTDLAPEHTMVVAGLPVTTPERTIVDLAAVTRPATLRSIIASGLVTQRIEMSAVVRVFDDIARRGKPGVAALRSILEDLGGEPIVVESELERRFLDVVRAAGLPDPAVQFSVPWRSRAAGRVDFAYPDVHLIIECDGRRWHTALEAFEVDRRRDNLAQLAGWRVLRFTWADVTQSAPQIVRAIRAALASRPAA
jgi:hypothetical protein